MFYPLGVYLKEIQRIPVLEIEEESRLSAILCNGHTKKEKKQAKERIIAGNQWLVTRIAFRYAGNAPHALELIGEGNWGLFKVVESYGSHVEKPIKAYIGPAIRNSIIDYFRRNKRHHSIDIKSEETGNYMQIADDKSEPPEKDIEKQEIRELVSSLLKRLTPMEQEIIICRFGLSGNAFTLEELASYYGFRSCSSISRIQENALEYMRWISGVEPQKKKKYSVA